MDVMTFSLPAAGLFRRKTSKHWRSAESESSSVRERRLPSSSRTSRTGSQREKSRKPSEQSPARAERRSQSARKQAPRGRRGKADRETPPAGKAFGEIGRASCRERV